MRSARRCGSFSRRGSRRGSRATAATPRRSWPDSRRWAAPQAQEGRRLPTLNCVQVPAGVDEAAVRKGLLPDHGIEIGGGLGPLAGKVWRIGLMGEGARQESVLVVLAALEQALARQGKAPKAGTATAAAPEGAAGGAPPLTPPRSPSPPAPSSGCSPENIGVRFSEPCLLVPPR